MRDNRKKLESAYILAASGEYPAGNQHFVDRARIVMQRAVNCGWITVQDEDQFVRTLRLALKTEVQAGGPFTNDRVIRKMHWQDFDHERTDWENDCLYWWGRVLTGKDAHWCHDFDGLPIDADCKEYEACNCID